MVSVVSAWPYGEPAMIRYNLLSDGRVKLATAEAMTETGNTEL